MPENGYRKRYVHAYAAENGLTYQQAHHILAAQPAQPAGASLIPVDEGELVHLLLIDRAGRSRVWLSSDDDGLAKIASRDGRDRFPAEHPRVQR